MLKSMSLHSSSGTRRYMCVEVQSCALTPATYSYTPEAAGCPRLQKALVNPRRPHTIMLPQMPRQQHLQRQRSDKQSADCPDGSLCHIRGCKSLHRGWPQRRSSARPPQHLRARSSNAGGVSTMPVGCIYIHQMQKYVLHTCMSAAQPARPAVPRKASTMALRPQPSSILVSCTSGSRITSMLSSSKSFSAASIRGSIVMWPCQRKCCRFRPSDGCVAGVSAGLSVLQCG